MNRNKKKKKSQISEDRHTSSEGSLFKLIESFIDVLDIFKLLSDGFFLGRRKGLYS